MDKGIIGLRNRGNTCYLNTAIQCLSNLKLLTEYFLSNNYIVDLNNRFNELKDKKMNEILLTKEYAKLIKVLWNSSSSIEPKTFHELIQRFDDRFDGYEQHDTQELLGLILDHLHEGLIYNVIIKYKGNIENKLDEIMVESIKEWKKTMNDKYSIIAELFFGQFINTVNSLESKNKDKQLSKTFEMFSILSIPVHGITLYDSLSKYFEKEILESKYLDQKTNKSVDAYRQIRLMKVPKYLIIVLKKYKNNLSKLNISISFPIEDLNLSQYCEGYDSIDCNLKLISIGCHKGALNGGHYFSVCRHINEKWYKYDDDDISEININNEKNNLFKDGYILIYEKND